MSGGYSAIRWLQVGSQSGTTDTPGVLCFVDAQTIEIDATQSKIPVVTQSTDGEYTKGVLGPKSGGVSFSTLVRGKGSGAGNGTAAVGGECDVLFDALFGAEGSHGTGLTSGTSHAVDSLKLADTSGFPAGNAFLVDSDATSGARYEAREVTSVTTNTSVAFDRDLTGAPADSTVAYASTSWYADADDSDHTHIYARVEGENWRRDFLGCGVKCSLSCPPGGLATFSWSLMCDDWDDTAEANPTYSSPTSAGGLVAMGSPFYIGATKTELISLSLDFGFNPVARTATDGPNGQVGWVYEYTGAKLSGSIYHSDTTLNAFQSTTASDVAFQLGDTSSSSTPGNCLYVRIPALDVESAKIGSHAGIDTIDFSGKATRPSSGNGSVRIHLFASAS